MRGHCPNGCRIVGKGAGSMAIDVGVSRVYCYFELAFASAFQNNGCKMLNAISQGVRSCFAGCCGIACVVVLCAMALCIIIASLA